MKDDQENKNPLDMEDGQEEKEDGGSVGIALGLCFGSAFGLLVQMFTGSITWLPIGVAIGLGLGTAFGASGRKKNK